MRIFHELSRYSYDKALEINLYLQLGFMQNSVDKLVSGLSLFVNGYWLFVELRAQRGEQKWI